MPTDSTNLAFAFDLTLDEVRRRSAGHALDERTAELWREGKPDEYFFTAIYGSAVVEHLVAGTG